LEAPHHRSRRTINQNARRRPTELATLISTVAISKSQSGVNSQARADLMRIFAAAVSAVQPRRVVARAFQGQLPAVQGIHEMLEKARRIYLLAAGKAAIGMAIEGRERLGSKLADALVIVPGHFKKEGDPYPELHDLRVAVGAHPIPDESSEAAGRAALELVASAERDDLVVFMLSGGASALMAVPGDGLKLGDKVTVTSALMNAGASIRELNTVRRHLSAIKGGHLLKASQAKFLSLILSDVPGNDLAAIGSGPTSPDPTTYSDTVAILKRRRVWGRAPEIVRDYLERGAAGEVHETLKPDDSAALRRAHNVIIADNGTATEAACEVAAALHYDVVRGRDLGGDANETGAALGTFLCGLAGNRICVISGGETSVQVKGNGKGGRSQQAALAAAFELARLGARRQLAALFAGTDGIDGPTEAAGAIATPTTVMRGNEAGLDPKSALDRNDCYNFFKGLGDLVIIGPTGTNVADIFVGLANY
jgi:glycerate 2-kinase